MTARATARTHGGGLARTGRADGRNDSPWARGQGTDHAHLVGTERGTPVGSVCKDALNNSLGDWRDELLLRGVQQLRLALDDAW